VFGKEVGENGTPHLQGYVQLKKKMRMAQVKKFISSRAHLEVSRGSPEQASRYLFIEEDSKIGIVKRKMNLKS